jgi:subtilase family serine protease
MNKVLRGVIIASFMIFFAFVFVASAGLATNVYGYGYYQNGDVALFDQVNITNTNTSVEWNQSTTPDVRLCGRGKKFRLTLDYPTDVVDGHILKFYAINGTWTNTTYVMYAYTGLDRPYNITFKGTTRKSVISIDSPNQNISVGDTFTVNITVNPAGNEIYCAHYELFFDPSILNATSQKQATFLSQDGAPTTVIINEINNTIGKIEYNETRTGEDNGTSTTGVLASITFKAVAQGTCNLSLNNVFLSDKNGTGIATSINNGTVTVKGATPFNISGFVVYSDGEQVLNPNVTLTNMNTSEVFLVETNTSSNYYHVSTDSEHVSVGDILHFHASNANTTEFNYTVTEEELNTCGFVLNITIIPLPKPDLVVAEIPAQLVFANVSNNISAVIKNDGDADVTSSFNVSLAVNGTIVDTTTVAGLNAGNTTIINFVWTPSQTANYTITVNTDCDANITESNETNNEFSKFFTVLPQKPELTVSELKAYHYHTSNGVWFNLTNFVNISVVNGGYSCNRFNVSLEIEGIEFKKEILGLGAGAQANIIFNWTPIGWDCMKGGSPKDYSINAFVDSDNNVDELNETNNNANITETVYWNGYSADEPLNNIAHGKVRGGLYYTTGNSYYRSGGLKKGKSVSALYNISLPEGAKVKLARLNLYYTWAAGYPDPEVNITTPDGTTYHNVTRDKSYHDSKCYGGYDKPWGNLVYNLTAYINQSGIYNVTVKELSSNYPCYAGRGIVIVYEDNTMPLQEYWINEGADVLIGGRRGDGGGLSLAECINNATFQGYIDLNKINNATLAVVAPWSNNPWDVECNVLYFNGFELGRDVYTGYQAIGDMSLGSIRMTGSGYPQVGVNLSDVTDYLNASDNVVGQGDNRDCMMPSNAFLVVEYKDEERPEFDTGPGTYPSISGTHKGTITPKHDIAVRTMYTYPSAGTGGHTEFVELNNETFRISATWVGYQSDYHNITFPHQFTLLANHTYNYTIRTGSYPQIHHTNRLELGNGTIRCHEFIDANDRKYNDSIPAILLSL